MKFPILLALPIAATIAAAPIDDTTKERRSIVDEVIWVVGDEAILLSDVEQAREQAAAEGQHWTGDPDCLIPEQIAVQKLFLHQAAIDSIEVTESDVAQRAEDIINNWIQMASSREKLEEYKGKTISQMRSELRDMVKDQYLVQKMRDKIVDDVQTTPSDVRRYFKDLPEDSIPYVPTEVEVQIVAQTPKVAQAEIDRVKDELRSFTDRINKGEASFSTLARLYSEDPGTARQGGELDYTGRGMLDPAFAAVAFNLTDPKKVSKIVESEFGFHIIQLVDKRGDKIKVRHILMKPQVNDSSINASIARLDSIRSDIKAGKFTFDAAASVISDDKDTRNNHGLMSHMIDNSPMRTSKFRMQDLPAEVARAVDGLPVDSISAPFTMINQRGKTVCAIAKVKSRTQAHRATITEDYQVMQDVVTARRKADVLKEWVAKKIKATYVRINDRYRPCKFEHEGWNTNGN